MSDAESSDTSADAAPISSNESRVAKKQKTPAQMAAFAKALKTREENTRRRKEEAARLEADARKELEASVVKKAVSIKKKQIKAQLALDEISDDDEPIQAVRERVKKVAERPPPKQLFVFV